MQTRLDGPDRDAQRHRYLGQWQPEVVVQDDNRASRNVEAPKRRVDELPVVDGARGVVEGRGVDLGDLDLDAPSLPASREVDAGVDDEAMQPGVESIRIA